MCGKGLANSTGTYSCNLHGILLFYPLSLGFVFFVVLGIKHKALHMVKHARQVLYHWTTSLALVLVCSRFDSFCLPATTFPRLSFLSVNLFPALLVFCTLAQHQCFHDNSPVLVPPCFPLFFGLLLFSWPMLYCFVWYFQFAFSSQIYAMKNVWVLREVHYLKK